MHLRSLVIVWSAILLFVLASAGQDRLATTEGAYRFVESLTEDELTKVESEAKSGDASAQVILAITQAQFAKALNTQSFREESKALAEQ